MKSSELMLGDWLQHADGSYHQVRVIEVGHFACGLPHLWEYNNQFSPVLLTREILEKNGFEHVGDKYYVVLLPSGTWITLDMREDAPIGQTSLNEINYVHEFQHFLKVLGSRKEVVL